MFVLFILAMMLFGMFSVGRLLLTHGPESGIIPEILGTLQFKAEYSRSEPRGAVVTIYR
jgi:hypothetical protein